MKGSSASIIVLIAGLTIQTGSMATAGNEGPESQRLIPMGDDSLIPSERLQATEDEALAGSAVAAEALMFHHMELVSRTIGTNDEVRFWERIAAENGSCVAQESYARTLSGGVMEPDARKIKRAAFWRRKAQECRDAERSKEQSRGKD